MPEDNVKKPFLSGKHIVLIILAAGLAVAGVGAVRFSNFRGNDKQGSDVVTFAVKRGPLRISVTESGTIKARDQVILKCEVEGRTSILWLIDEGVSVEKGDLLVELDGSTLLDNRIDQQIMVQNTEAAFITASENFAVVENQAQSDVELADLTLEFAKLDLKKYKEGDYPNLLKEAEIKITLAEEELEQAEETLSWSKKLFNEKYISNTELQRDELAKKKANLNLELAKNELDLLEKFTNSRNLSQLNSDVKQAEMALERTKRSVRADIAQARADLKAKESEFSRQKDKLAKLEEQIVKTKIYAPAAGQVIYATSARRGGWRSSTQPLDIGQDVQERQELIYLPTSASSKAEVDIHESSLKKVQIGLPTVITIDALPGKIFLGEVANIAPLPDATSSWLNPDLKVYNTDIYLDSNDASLRTGMSCKAEVIVEQYEDTLYIPVQAVLRVGGDHTVYVVTDHGYEAREVEIGMDNNRMVRIISGLEEGQKVMLTPPLKAAELEQSTEPGSDESEYDNGSELYQSINGRLEEYRQQPAGQQSGRRSSGRGDRGGRRQGGQGQDSAGSEERRKRFENLSDEEKEKMKKRFENMSPEDKAKMRRQRGGGRQGR
ncbi:MAG: efflux RND transporter periplasmic adaptor subunit [Planctomycetota bacterium]|jgi:HlyD family secretion protein